MLLVDDQRRYVTANAPACGLLELAPEEVPWHRIDDFMPPEDQDRLHKDWEAFLANGALEGWYRVCLPTGSELPVEFSATANVLPGRHLSVVIPRAGIAADDSPAETVWTRIIAPDIERLPLTEREHEVLGLVAAGLQSGGIAERLFLSPETIKSHVQNAMTKLGAHTRAHAVAIALRSGELGLDEEPGTRRDTHSGRGPRSD